MIQRFKPFLLNTTSLLAHRRAFPMTRAEYERVLLVSGRMLGLIKFQPVERAP